ncbi:adenylyl-sulfate kinase [Lederbergia sp. NSJ-179]|nr:adenylyl-sulfate kinase [Lederbergia sp. NSJ-179]MCJ7843614.1 adenylyl-sulfate kinase [Lederbergia sp. NSJ-179]
MKVYWITGLSGVGKTTVAKMLYENLKLNSAVVLLDGDILRKVFGSDLG